MDPAQDRRKTVTIGAWASQAQYLDPSMEFDVTWEQVNQHLNDHDAEHSVLLVIPITNLSVASLEYLFSGVLGLRQTYNTDSQRVGIKTSMIDDPQCLSAQILPPQYADHLDELWAWMLRQRVTAQKPWHGFSDQEIRDMDQYIAWMRQGELIPHHQLVQRRGDFYRYCTQHDMRHGTNFVTVFPEMQHWWNLCGVCAGDVIQANEGNIL